MKEDVSLLIKAISLLREIEGHLMILKYNAEVSNLGEDILKLNKACDAVRLTNSLIQHFFSKDICLSEPFVANHKTFRDIETNLFDAAENIEKTAATSILPSKDELLDVMNLCKKVFNEEKLGAIYQALREDEEFLFEERQKLKDLCDICVL